jgi:glycosyltransferase 2 family protein
MSTPAPVSARVGAAGPPPRRRRSMRLVRIALGAVALVFVVVAVVQRWHQVRHQLGQVSAGTVALSGLAVLAAVVAGMLSWRAVLADLGSPLPVRSAARVMLLGQLGKYVPGSLWSVVAQTELARDLGVPRRRSAAAGMVYNALGLGIGLLLAVVSLPALLRSEQVPGWVVWVVVVSPLSLAVFAPPVLTRLVNLALRALRRQPLEHPFSWAGTGRAVAWMIVMWACLSVHVWLLAIGLGAGAGAAALPSIGGFAAAWSVGFLVIVAPAGAGVRETLLTVTLAGALPGGTAAALTIALVSRALVTAGDVVAALVGYALRGRPPVTTEPTSGGAQ